MENIICMKWGTKYGPDYVNQLAAMVRHNISRPYQLICFTDEPEGIEDSVVTRPLPKMDIDPTLPERGWRKLSVFSAELADLSGTALFLDLDLVILGSLDEFFDVPGKFRIVNDWNLNNFVGNSSVFRFEIGRHTDLPQYYLDHAEEVRANHRNEQCFLSWWMKERGLLEYWDPAWCKSFKTHSLRTFPFGYFLPPRHPGPETKILVFHGQPNPSQVINGWHSPSFLRSALPAPWLQSAWNVTR